MPRAAIYSGSPRLDVYSEDWLVYSLDGDIRIFNQRDLRLEVGLPIAVNSQRARVRSLAGADP